MMEPAGIESLRAAAQQDLRDGKVTMIRPQTLLDLIGELDDTAKLRDELVENLQRGRRLP